MVCTSGTTARPASPASFSNSRASSAVYAPAGHGPLEPTNVSSRTYGKVSSHSINKPVAPDSRSNGNSCNNSRLFQTMDKKGINNGTQTYCILTCAKYVILGGAPFKSKWTSLKWNYTSLISKYLKIHLLPNTSSIWILYLWEPEVNVSIVVFTLVHIYNNYFLTSTSSFSNIIFWTFNIAQWLSQNTKPNQQSLISLSK